MQETKYNAGYLKKIMQRSVYRLGDGFDFSSTTVDSMNPY